MDSPSNTITAPDYASEPPVNIPVTDKIDYIYDMLKKYEPILDMVAKEAPEVIAKIGPMLEGLSGNPMLKMLGFGRG